MRLAGKVAIVTGGASGIGRASAMLFGREGARVLIADIDERRGRETAQAVAAQGNEAHFIRVDVAKEDDSQRMIEETVGRWGRIDVLFNNAGVVLVKPLEERGLWNNWTESPVRRFDRLDRAGAAVLHGRRCRAWRRNSVPAN